MQIVRLLALLSMGFGGYMAFATMLTAESAPQQAAGFAMAMAFAVIPYTIARTLGDMASGGRKEGENGAPGSMSRNAAMIAGIGAAVIVGGYAYSIISAVMRR